MLTDINQKNTRDKLNVKNLAEYWQGYFSYRDNSNDLYELAHRRLVEQVERIKTSNRPYIDSQQVIGQILTDFGNQHNFHRQFREQHPGLHPNQILGMHLYDIMINDDEVWVYTETQHPGHLFPHATYFVPRNNQ